MTLTSAERSNLNHTAKFSAGVDNIVRQAAQVSRDVRQLKTAVADTVDDGVHAARRALIDVRRRAEHLDDLKFEAMYRIRRRPLQTLALAAGVGAVAGLVIGWTCHRVSSHGQA